MKQKRGARPCSPDLLVNPDLLLLARPGLHPVAGVAQIEGELLAFEPCAGQRAGSVIVVLHHCRVVLRRSFQVHYLRRNFGDHGLALHDADFHIRTAAVPLQFVLARFQLGSVDARGTLQNQISLRRCERAGGQQQRQPHHQTLRYCGELHGCSLFSFPKLCQELVGAARCTTSARKHLCFPTNRIECCRRGWCRKATSLCCRDGVFLTWAAKPSVRKSPDPAINLESHLASVTSTPVFSCSNSTPRDTHSPL